MKNDIEKHEQLYRSVIMNPSFWKPDLGKPSSAVFKDSKGVSVDRNGRRTQQEVNQTFIERFGMDNMKAIVSVSADFCYELDTHLVYSPTKDNVYHAEIHDSQNKVPLRSSKAKRLANNCTITWENNL